MSAPLPEVEDAEDHDPPDYLTRHYWWAYVHPRAVRFFERPWLTNLILCGQYRRLSDAALAALGALDGRTLQVACVYGNLTGRLADRLRPAATLDVIDVLPIQVENLRAKLGDRPEVHCRIADATRLPYEDGMFDRALAFFLLHEQPVAARRASLAEALRVVRPGGHLVVVDYHQPSALHPLRPLLYGILSSAEPFALDLWRGKLEDWLPPEGGWTLTSRKYAFGGLYQVCVVQRR